MLKVPDLPLVKRIRLRIFGRVYLEHRQPEGWSGALPFYLVSCPEHGPFEDYPHGWEGRLRCPRCHRYTVVGTEGR